MRSSLVSLALLFFFSPVLAQTFSGFTSDYRPHAETTLVVEQSYYAPDSVASVALFQTIEPGWHTYWVNPGDSGEPVQVIWDLPEGFKASPLSYPVPHAIPYGPLTNFGYEEEAVFLTDITIPNGADGNYEIQGHAIWLACSDICVPEEAKLSASIHVTTAEPDPNDGSVRPDNPEFNEWRSRLPVPASFGVEYQANEGTISFAFDIGSLSTGQKPNIHFFPIKSGFIDNAAPQSASWSADGPVLSIKSGYKFSEPNAARPDEIAGVLVIEEETGDGILRAGYEVTAVPGIIPAGNNRDGLTLPLALAFAFLGGLILNLMPCVFPVLFIKVLGLIKTREMSAGHAKVDGLVYMSGVVISFLVIAGLLIGLRQTGQAIGWGYQLQNPVFVFVLTCMMFVIGLSLITQISFGAGLSGTGDQLARRSGLTGTFFTGVLATVVATPCTAPFMAAALGFALGRPPAEALLIFSFLGLGMAAPFTLACFYPPLLSRLPKPGPWMETLRQFFAFPMFAAAAWLGWVLSEQIGSSAVIYLTGAIIGLSFLFWLESKIKSRSTGWAAFAAGLVIITATAFSLGDKGAISNPINTSHDSDYGISWEPFSRSAIKSGLADGRPVFVNMTAAWCITCKVNERLVFTSNDVHQALAEKNVLMLKGDWTNYDPAITAMLEDYGRSGVPLYLYFSKSDPEGTLLPQILTEDVFLDAISHS